MRPIDADVLIAACEETAKIDWNKRTAPVSWSDAYEGFIDTVEEIPTIDAVPVVRCKRCRYAKWSEKNNAHYCKRRWAMHKVRERDFCSYGERRSDD